MTEEWTGTLVGRMHTHKVTRKRLAQHMGLTQEYVSMVLNGKKTPKNAHTRFSTALEALIATDMQAAARTPARPGSTQGTAPTRTRWQA
ncbi:MAG: hypothetical protein GXY32_08830 [Ruminococcaceae bacterium]|nr:hypothetical protein [Oscillospiraceae bacterium]